MTTCVWRYRLTYAFLLLSLSALVLGIFLYPNTKPHFKGKMYTLSISMYHRARFVEMVEGRAYKPFVYRTLLPSTVRLLASLTPSSAKSTLSDFVDSSGLAKRAFNALGWETSRAYLYFLACGLMWFSYCGFAHFSSKFILLTCKIPHSWASQSALAALSLLGLPAFFRYGSFIYDPIQLLLFTSALYFLVRGNIAFFMALFVFACVNKETAVLLIPVCWFIWRDACPRGKCLRLLSGMACVYISIKGAISFAYRGNPGSFVEFHLLDHNIPLILYGWNFHEVFLWLGFILLLFYKWREKAYFLRMSFLCVLPPLVGLALLFGYLDEWRGYYEAYPIVLALVVDSFLRIRALLEQNSRLVP